MFEIYGKEKPGYLTYAAIGCAVISFFVTVFFVAYLKLNGVLLYAVCIVPIFVYKAVIASDYRTRNKDL